MTDDIEAVLRTTIANLHSVITNRDAEIKALSTRVREQERALGDIVSAVAWNNEGKTEMYYALEAVDDIAKAALTKPIQEQKELTNG